MRELQENTMKHALIRVGFLFCLSATNLSVHCREHPSIQKNEISWAEEFLRAVYPDLNGKKYGLTVETYSTYDPPRSPLQWLRLDVGEGPKEWLMGYSGGCTGTFTPPLPWEQSEPRPNPQSAPSPAEQEQAQRKLEKLCPQGPIYPKQLLTAGFRFDTQGRLSSFTADGPFIDDREVGNKLYEIVQAHPDMSEKEIIAALKSLGAKYGPDDKEQFTRDLPLNELQRFLGKLELISVTSGPLSADRAELSSWPLWIVTARTILSDNTSVTYEMSFNRLKGSIQTLRVLPKREAGSKGD